jgi:hypothetical protein
LKGPLPSLIATFLTALTLFALAGFQVTTHAAAVRLLGRQAAALIEIDRWLPNHKDDLELLARDRPQGVIAVKDLPLNIVLPSSQIIDVEEPVLRDTLVRSMGERLYDEGNGAFRNSQGNPQKPALDDPLRWSAGLLNRDAHAFWKLALAVITLALLASLMAVLLTGGTPLTPLAIGSGLAFLFSLAVWLLAGVLEGGLDSPVDREVALAVRDGAWIGLRNGLAVAVVAIGMRVLIGSFGNRERDWDSQTWELQDGEADPDAPPV